MALRRFDLLLCLAAHFCGVALAAAPASAQGIQLTPLVGRVLSPPWPVAGSDGRTHLVYELILGNATRGMAELRKVEIVDQPSGKVLLALDQEEVAKRLSLGGRRGAETARLDVAQFGVMFLHLAINRGEPIPRALAHRIAGHFSFARPALDLAMTIADVAVVDMRPVVLGPPLIGKGYLAGDGCCDTIRHVRALLPLNGGFVLAQRFAIDWEQADVENRLVKGDPKVLGNYNIFGKEVIAVADGTVVGSRNDLPEQVPGALPANLPIDQADGNFVVLDIGGSFVLYAHLQPGSVAVKPGDKVKRGDRLGKVGNTGNSQAPHLHLHVMDGPSPLLSNGLPYVFQEFTATAIDEAGTADFDKAEATGSPLTLTQISPPQLHREVLPLNLLVVEFSR
jgi:hypothetical protein